MVTTMLLFMHRYFVGIKTGVQKPSVQIAHVLT